MAKDETWKLTRQWPNIIRIARFFLWLGQKLWSSMLLNSASQLSDCNNSQQIFLGTKFILEISSSFMKSVWLGGHFFSQLLIHNFHRVTTGLYGISLTRTSYQKFCRSNSFTILFRFWFSMPQTFAFAFSWSLCCRTPFTSSAIILSVGVSLKRINSLSIGFRISSGKVANG